MSSNYIMQSCSRNDVRGIDFPRNAKCILQLEIATGKFPRIDSNHIAIKRVRGTLFRIFPCAYRNPRSSVTIDPPYQEAEGTLR